MSASLSLDRPRPRSALSAGILSVLTPGLGHLYTGHRRTAVILFACDLLLSAGLAAVHYGLLPRFWILAALLLTAIVLYGFAVIDSARKAREPDPRGFGFDGWYVYVGVLVAMPALTALLSVLASLLSAGQSGYYNHPSASMQPTILQGETFLADTRYYRNHAPSRGEIVVYKHPKETGVHFVKRIVAVAGDRVEVKEGRTIVNGAPVAEPYANFGDPAFSMNTTAQTVVPDASVYVLGDNRANSADSRLPEHGPVPVSNLVARATELVFAAELRRVGKWIGTPEPR